LKIDALVIENTFTDMPTIARKYNLYENKLTCSLGIPGLYYLAPILCSEKWRSISLIPKITQVPMLFLAGEMDEVIPKIHMQELYASAERATTKGKFMSHCY
jgi:predicted esterase